MIATTVVWAALALAQALGIAWLWTGARELLTSPPRVVFPLRDMMAGWGCLWRVYDGLLSRWWVWAAVALLPLLLVPPRRHASASEGVVAPTSPYRVTVPASPRAPDAQARRRHRGAGRAVVAAAGASWLLVHAHPQAVITGPQPLHLWTNGVAALEALVAAATVLAYVAAACATPRPPRRRSDGSDTPVGRSLDS